MKQKRVLAIGMALGMIVTLTVSTFAEPLIREVKSYIRDDYTFVINGETAEVPSDYHVMSYEDRSYLPARFLAEKLGASVDWDGTNKIITITPKDAIVPPDSPNTPTTPPAIENATQYKEIPVMKYTSDYELTVKMYSKDDKGDRVWILLKNKQDDPIQLNQIATKITADGKMYTMDSKQASDFDRRWYNDIQKDEEVEGFLLLPIKIKDPEKLSLDISIAKTNKVTGETESEVITFNIGL